MQLLILAIFFFAYRVLRLEFQGYTEDLLTIFTVHTALNYLFLQRNLLNLPLQPNSQQIALNDLNNMHVLFTSEHQIITSGR